MKILHLLQSNRFSGAENVAYQIINMMRNDEDLEMVYSSCDGQIREALLERNIAFAPMSDITLREVKRVINEQKPDIIHAHDRTASILAALASNKIPIVVHMHVNNNKGFTCFIKNSIWTILSFKYKHIFWVADSAFNNFQFRRFVSKKSQILYNVIDEKSLWDRTAEDKNKYHYDIVYIGRLSYQKDPERLMHIFQKVCEKKPDVQIAVIGEGDYSDYVTDFILNNHLDQCINYLGYRNNPLKILHDSKVLVMTSRFEGTPIIAIEAQLLGVPVISTPVDGMKKLIINGQNGFLSNDDDELIYHIMDIITNTKLQQSLATRSKEMSLQYSDVKEFRRNICLAYSLCDELR